MKKVKKFMKLCFIPAVMIVISIIMAFIANDGIRKIFVGLQFALLAVHILIDYIDDKQKKGD